MSTELSTYTPLICHRCGRMLSRGEGSFYVVNIEAFADPSPPNLDDLDANETRRPTFDELIEQMRDLSEQEMMDQVYRKLRVLLCDSCYPRWIENPTG